jgi:hypothetical protein
MKIWDLSNNKQKLLNTQKSNFGSIFSFDITNSSLNQNETVLSCAGEKNKILLFHNIEKKVTK